jgi:hypothetical protein
LASARTRGDDAEFPALPFIPPDPADISSDDMISILNDFMFSS